MSLPENSTPIALSRDGTRLATSTREGVRVWDTSTWKELRLLPGASGPIAFSPDGKTLATNSTSGITLWPVDGAADSLVLQNSADIFIRRGPWFRTDRGLAFSPDGKSVVAARNVLSERGVFVLSIWEAQSGKELATMPDDPQHIEHTGVISSLAFSPDGRTLGTASMDHSIRLWDFAMRQRVATLQGHRNEVWAMAFSPDGQTVVSAAKDGAVKLWPIRQQQKEDVLPGAWEPLTISHDSQTLVALNRQGTVAFFNLTVREPEREFQVEGTRFGRRPSVAVSRNLKILAQGLPDGSVKLWNTETRALRTFKASDSGVDFIALSPDGQILITGERDGPLRWWDLHDTTNASLTIEAERALFSQDGRMLVTIQRGNTVQLWDVASRSPRNNLVLEPPPGFNVALSPDGKIFATDGGRDDFDNAIRLWDTATGKLIGTCSGHKQSVFSVAFSPDGKTLASASDDSTLKFWNVVTQQELLTIRRIGGTLQGLIFSPNGRWLVGGNVSPRLAELRFYDASLLTETDRPNAK